MATFNQLAASRFAELARRIIGEDVSLDAVAPELLLALVLEDDRPEWLFPSTALLSLGDVQALNAAQTSGFRIRNPTGSNILAVIKKVIVTSSVAGDTIVGEIALGNTDLASLSAAGAKVDTRFLSILTGACVISRSNNPAAGGGSIFEQATGASSAVIMDWPVVLGPGSTLTFRTLAINSTFNFTISWTERSMRAEETK